jgi:GTP cyclohydrolase I
MQPLPELMENTDLKEAATLMYAALIKIGVPFNSERDKTPERFLKYLLDQHTPVTFEFTIFPSTYSGMVDVKDIPFVSVCEHHLLPFFGKCHIAYIPDQQVAGLSKLPRTVELCAKGLWTQEHLTQAILKFIREKLNPKGLIVVMDAEHTCMTLRGACATGSTTRTCLYDGVFQNFDARSEFLNSIK